MADSQSRAQSRGGSVAAAGPRKLHLEELVPALAPVPRSLADLAPGAVRGARDGIAHPAHGGVVIPPDEPPFLSRSLGKDGQAVGRLALGVWRLADAAE